MSKPSKKTKSQAPAKNLTKQEKLFKNLFRTTQQFISGRAYRPMTAEELLARLHFAPQHAHLLDQILQELTTQGFIELSHQKYIWKSNQANVVTGILSVHPRGFGFLRPDDPTLFSEDIFIPKHLTQNAVDGDTVEVLVNTEVVSEKGPEGKVISILSRGRTHIAGIISKVESFGDIAAYAPLLGTTQRVIVQPHPDLKLREGDRVVMEVVEWGAKGSHTQCRVTQYIGHISDPSCDIPAAIEEYQLRSKFPKKALQQAKDYGTRVFPQDIKEREDLRHLDCFTIDPDTAKDYDDAINLSKDEKGHYHLGVHIADVSHYVVRGSPLDKEAQERCNSTYFPGFCLPMLPHELSSHLCSLKPNVNRLTASVLMEFDPEGSLVNYRITRSVIKSRKRFTYREAKLVLEGKKKSPFLAPLKLMLELCKLLKIKRYERGSLEFSMPELMVLVSSEGAPTGLDHVEYDETHQLVEEFMLKANETVATYITQQGKGLAYRVHDEPSEENMRDFSMLVRNFGYQLSDIPTPREMQLLFEEATKTPYAQYLATSYIKRMRLAVYSADNIGHYGLGLTHYCHFTSPIRRYVDLVVHRILFGEAEDRETLESISLECSEQERISAKAESNVKVLKKLRLLKTWQEKEPGKQYEAIITRVKPFGIYFEVLDLMLESFLHISELENDYFVYDEQQGLLKGRHEGYVHASGSRIFVMLKNVYFINLETEWSLIGSRIKSDRKANKFKPSKPSDRRRAQKKILQKPQKTTIPTKQEKKPKKNPPSKIKMKISPKKTQKTAP
jgi:ribonuclease R